MQFMGFRGARSVLSVAHHALHGQVPVLADVVAGERGYVKIDGDSWAFEAERDYATNDKVRVSDREGVVVRVVEV